MSRAFERLDRQVKFCLPKLLLSYSSTPDRNCPFLPASNLLNNSFIKKEMAKSSDFIPAHLRMYKETITHHMQVKKIQGWAEIIK
jgi:hypothetical protein